MALHFGQVAGFYPDPLGEGWLGGTLNITLTLHLLSTRSGTKCQEGNKTMVLTFRAPVLADPSSGNCQGFRPSASTLVTLHVGAQIPNLMDLRTRLPYSPSLSNFQPHWPL